MSLNVSVVDKLRKMLDLNLFQVEKGGNPELIRESQRRRGASVELVDKIIALYDEWRRGTVYYSKTHHILQ